MTELLSVPLKKTSEVDLVKPLKTLISSTYSTADQVAALHGNFYLEIILELSIPSIQQSPGGPAAPPVVLSNAP